MEKAQGTACIFSDRISVETSGNGDMHDLTGEVEQLIKESGLTYGQVLLFVPGSTASLTTIEYEQGLIQDFPEAMEIIAPSRGKSYNHDLTWHDGNGHSHIRASMLGPSLTVPFSNGKLQTGTWQQIVFIDWDNRGRHREVIAQISGIIKG